jgi:hypothetical protein
MEACWCMPFGVSFTSPPLSGRKPTEGKQVRSLLASILLLVEKLDKLAGADGGGAGVGLLWRSVFFPRNFVQLPPAEACCCFCSSSCFVLRNRPPDPRARFMAWRWRDSWRYGWDRRGNVRTNEFCNLTRGLQSMQRKWSVLRLVIQKKQNTSTTGLAKEEHKNVLQSQISPMSIPQGA